MRIVYLAENLAFVPALAEWHHLEWSHLGPEESLEECARRLRERAGHGGIPTVFVAVSNGSLLGSASLIEHDMDGRGDLSPWLAAVFVAPASRHHGIGTALVRRVVEEAGNLRVPKLYLYTTSKENEEFYVGLGWSVFERVMYRGEVRVIMEIEPPNRRA